LRVAVDEKFIEVDDDKMWLYGAIDIKSKLLLEVDLFSRRGTDPAAAFLYHLIEKWFQTMTIRNDRFHSFCQGSQSYIKRWLRWFRHYYNRH
jgi:putative transposase